MEGKKKILIIDDNLKIQEILSKFLKEEGFEVVSVYTGRDGLEKACSDKPDLILLDLILPGEDGIEILKKLNSKTQSSLIPRIVLTNVDDRQEMELVKKEGVEKYLVKSHHKLSDILDEVREVLEKKKEIVRRPGGLIMMLNDDEFLLGIFENIFEKRGYRFCGFSALPPSGISDLIGTEKKPILIVVDMVMCFDGIKVIEELKASNELEDIPVVVLDNVFNEDEVKGAKDLGAEAYISMKENSPSQAVSKILEVL